MEAGTVLYMVSHQMEDLICFSELGTLTRELWLSTVQRCTCSFAISPSVNSGKEQHAFLHIGTLTAERGL
ncbi:hypothetical protein HBI56_138900 [Parastagonospora nodorum]|nr:hypothetical protein HBH53_119210 [Parastagonospora nodorum]KAH3970579.1 hypothetical protein HBH51_115630 [Parastagonospora nodorum]KAH3971752.1 hypothetical protein HBH52_157890 [Parastagonospora nodorum]KAH3996312.1 hypothetical protein HBI10_156990 [Parastagonospora nodorum]KAH4018996.1 hypothetical protein HBI13_129080 [Parastagonospora nodorum]